jgi:2-polyprenyl-3-methyl-5-hydroxy-6-metoxy-1,4-benzoquinol methylase
MASITDEHGYNQGFVLNPAQIKRLQRRAEAIVTEMRLLNDPGIRSQARILELGCGTGELASILSQLSGANVTGVDISLKFIATAQERFKDIPRLNFAVVDLSEEKPGSDSDKYDYIVGNGILHHLYYHLDQILPALAEWLMPGGRLIFWEPNLFNPYIYLIFSYPYFRKLARLEPDEMACTPAYMKRKLHEAGFCDINVTTRDFLLPNTPTCMVPVVITVGDIMEKLPLLRLAAQSIFISAKKSVRP